MNPRYPVCSQCHYDNREPTICEACDQGSEFEPIESIEDLREQLRRKVGKPDKTKKPVLIYKSRPAPEEPAPLSDDFLYPGFDRPHTFTPEE